MDTLNIDIETFSSVDIKSAGAYKYAQSEDFEILLFAYSFNHGPVQVVDLKNGEEVPQDIMHALQDENCTKYAYNSAFEWWCLNQCGFETPLEQWRCTMVQGLYCGYPAGLSAIGTAIGLPQDKRKLSTGSALIRYFCIPCKPTKTNGDRVRNLPHHAPEKWVLFKEYCKQDVVTEMEVGDRLFFYPVPEKEWELWRLDVRMNAFGVRVDMDLVQGALCVDLEIRQTLLREAIELTGLSNPNSNAQLLEWLQGKGLELENLQKATVKTLLTEELSEEVKKVLEIRQELSKTSLKKYKAMEDASCDDSRIRGILHFTGQIGQVGMLVGTFKCKIYPETTLKRWTLRGSLSKVAILQRFRYSMEMYLIHCPSLSVPRSSPPRDISLSCRTSPPLRQESSHGLLGKSGDWKYLGHMERFMRLRPLKCSESL